MATLRYKGIKQTEEEAKQVEDTLAVEEALRISINGNPFTVTMRTPGSDEALVRGLLFTEDIYIDKTEHPQLFITEKNNLEYTTAVNVVIDENKINKPYRNSRTLLSASSCGLCGKTELDELNCDHPLDYKEKLKAELVGKMFDQMNKGQNTFQQSGGSHAAAAFTMEGKLLSLHEDIGRHNAVDKVIGDLLLQGNLKQGRVLTVSGRISYEIVSKCFIAGIPFLAAVSAPSSLAVDYAKELGITLLGFCRNEKFTVYSHSGKINFGSSVLRQAQEPQLKNLSCKQPITDNE